MQMTLVENMLFLKEINMFKMMREKGLKLLSNNSRQEKNIILKVKKEIIMEDITPQH